jgi:hypothetical protein
MAIADKRRPSGCASKNDMGDRLNVVSGDDIARVIIDGSLLGKRYR